MINHVLTVLRDRLEEVLQTAHPQGERWVLLGNVGVREDIDLQTGSNKLVISLVSLQSDSSTGTYEPPSITRDDWYTSKFPPLYIDLYFVIRADFSDMNYEAALGMLSRVIGYFQESPVFTHDNSASLPAGLDKLVVEFVNLDFAQQSHLMTSTGMKYVPCVLYRVRRLPFAGAAISQAAPSVRSVGAGDPPGGPAR
ncbi:MAG TPA: Pvc16 family protein [Allosphingosinicella sp.]|jgi:hypothetical protein